MLTRNTWNHFVCRVWHETASDSENVEDHFITIYSDLKS